MAIRGQRFQVDWGADDGDEDGDEATPPLAVGSGAALDPRFIRDITERPTNEEAKPPSPPRLKSLENGFPAHKKRANPSTFRQRRSHPSTTDGRGPRSSNPANDPDALSAKQPKTEFHTTATDEKNEAGVESERQGIDAENQQRLADMSPEEIERARAELVAGMSSSLIERLLKRANIDDGRTDTNDSTSINPEEPPARAKADKKVTFESSVEGHERNPSRQAANMSDSDAAPTVPPNDLQPVSSFRTHPLPATIHFPHHPEGPSLDPSDPNFLENLHSKYFPDLPVDPSKLAWMAPIPSEGSVADRDSPYNPVQDSLPVSQIRFDFRGRLIPPQLARQIPATKGLHHHGLAPEAAGYTVPELAHLSRSAVAAQRCIAYQTLGRILYRLGRGDFGGESEELYVGLWTCIEDGRVIDTLVAEANRADGQGNRSCKITATEAVWLWQKGGGKKWKAQ
ncbi:hypothetical protein MMC19_006169 [Ptychographa xylographoides]|nr:hypothetical protein [Ptychographa xylographoides]